LVRKIWKVNANRLKEINWRPPEEFTVKAADGKTDLYGIMFKPSDFDPERKYPVVDFFDDEGLWGLMHFTSWPYLQALSEMGFIVFMLNERGMAGRNKAFLDSRYRNIGRFEIPDHVTALEQLARQRPYLDTERVGVCGGSRGGYMVLRAMLTAPDVYKVGVADSPDVDLLHDDHFYFEPAMGLPSDNPEGYEYASNVRLAKNLKGKLQIMVGTGDYGIYPGTMAMIAALVEERKPHDLVVLPNQPHQFTGAAGEFARDSNTRYLIQHLRP